jgi:hypothetical protein
MICLYQSQSTTPSGAGGGSKASSSRTLAHQGYPFSHDDLNPRQENILNTLRDQMRLMVYEDTLPGELFEPTLGEMRLRNMEGQLFSASLMQPKVKAPFVPRSQPELTDAKLLSKMLKGFCSILPMEYWAIEWCHRVEVRQFHLEIVEGHAMRSPDYSLGTYERSAIIRERGDIQNKSARIVKMIEYFSGGQYCDETQGYRSTEVHIQCCEGLNINHVAVPQMNVAQPLQPGGVEGHDSGAGTSEEPPAPGPVAALKASAEPRICAYQLVVCSRLLCPDKPPPEDNTGMDVTETGVGVGAVVGTGSPG